MTMHTPIADMSTGGVRYGVDLRNPTMSIGLRQQQARRSQPHTMSSRGIGSDIEGQARGYGLAEALSEPYQVTSGTWGEALAEAVAGGIRGRVARGDRRRELEQAQWNQDRAMKLEGARDSAIAQALMNFDPSNPGQAIARLSQGAPQEALEVARSSIANPPQVDSWSEPFAFENGMAQRNRRTGQVRVLTRPPARSNDYGADEEGWTYE